MSGPWCSPWLMLLISRGEMGIGTRRELVSRGSPEDAQAPLP